jgi:hypothetical protein
MSVSEAFRGVVDESVESMELAPSKALATGLGHDAARLTDESAESELNRMIRQDQSRSDPTSRYVAADYGRRHGLDVRDQHDEMPVRGVLPRDRSSRRRGAAHLRCRLRGRGCASP